MEGIIVGVDESDHARAALRWAVDHAAHTAQPVSDQVAHHATSPVVVVP